VALALARRHPVEIVSVDSMQVYRGMDIGTAKPAPEELARVRHHMVDVLEPQEPCSVGRYCRMAAAALGEIRSRGRRPLLVGGSPLYLKGIVWGLAESPPREPSLRQRLHEQAGERGSEAMHRQLSRLDPEAARRIHPNDVQRIVRALEVCELTGRPASDGQTQFSGPPRLRCRMVGLRWPRQQLYERIERRVDEMMARGLLEEVKGLHGRLGPQARQALGYKELADHLEGLVGIEEAVRLIKRNTRRFAKHQLTWFRHFAQLRWVDASAHSGVGALADRCETLLAGP
jgi:tRNA dimethylallyltransferase